MDVRCDRCDTEYDFDDALVSERGTTVRCTNCGHQFKVYPAQRAPSGTEYWVVRARDGQVFTFTTLRDLQSGLAAGRIGPDDELERGAGPARPLRTIAELEPFFPLWRAIKVDEGLLAVIAVEHDAVSKSVPRIPKGTDGRALQ